MPIDLSAFGESLQRGLGEIPPVAIAIALLAGPTLLFVGYRMIGITRRMQATREIPAEPFWVCHDCRSANELSHAHCYRCGVARDAGGELEVIVEQPTGPPAHFDVPAGLPFAAIAANPQQIPGKAAGVPVMSNPAEARDAVAVGPGRPDAVDATHVAETATAEAAAETEAETPESDLAATTDRRP